MARPVNNHFIAGSFQTRFPHPQEHHRQSATVTCQQAWKLFEIFLTRKREGQKKKKMPAIEMSMQVQVGLEFH
jgi:hypothetical protein